MHRQSLTQTNPSTQNLVRQNRALTLWANGVNQKLAVEKVKALFLCCLRTHLQNRFALKLNRPVALHANEVVMVIGVRLIDFVMLMIFRKLKFAQDSHPRHQLNRTVNRRQANRVALLLKLVIEILCAQVSAFRKVLKHVKDGFSLRSEPPSFFIKFGL